MNWTTFLHYCAGAISALLVRALYVYVVSKLKKPAKDQEPVRKEIEVNLRGYSDAGFVVTSYFTDGVTTFPAHYFSHGGKDIPVDSYKILESVRDYPQDTVVPGVDFRAKFRKATFPVVKEVPRRPLYGPLDVLNTPLTEDEEADKEAEARGLRRLGLHGLYPWDELQAKENE